MPEVGVEPTRPKAHEFESCASANSATPARGKVYYAYGLGLSMANQEINDEILIEQSRRGEIDAFNQLVLRYQNLIYSVAYRTMNDEPSASDVTQDTFIKAYQKLDTFRGGNFKAWLTRIASNLCYDELRRQKRRPRRRRVYRRKPV